MGENPTFFSFLHGTMIGTDSKGDGEMSEEIYNTGNKQGEYTLEDYDEISRECRVELIDGVLYEMETPDCVHQMILTKLWRVFDTYIDQNHGSCVALVSPLDVQLDLNNRTVVQPDIVIVCDRSKIVRRGVYGAPDLVVEIISDFTARRDMITKLDKYVRAGVREYWLIDPDKEQVTVYDFEDESTAPYITIYGFEEKIPVWIFQGKCIVDFQEIYESLSSLPGRQ